MLALKWLLMIVGAGLFGSAGALVAYDVYLSEQLRRLLSRNKTDESGVEVEPLARRPLPPVRYRLDPKRLESIHRNLPQPVGEQVVAPVVSTIYRQLAPNYVTREIFATKREELRTTAADAITARLASDGIIVREVLLRDLQLPEEYAKVLEGLLLKEQENERLGTEQEIKGKQEKIAEQ